MQCATGSQLQCALCVWAVRCAGVRCAIISMHGEPGISQARKHGPHNRCVCVGVGVYICMRVRARVYMCVCKHLCVSMCVCVLCVCVQACVVVSMCL